MYTVTIHGSSKTNNTIQHPDLGCWIKQQTNSKKVPYIIRQTIKLMPI